MDNVNMKNGHNEIVFDRVGYFIYPTARRYRAKLIGIHGGLQVGKWAVPDEHLLFFSLTYVSQEHIVMCISMLILT